MNIINFILVIFSFFIQQDSEAKAILDQLYNKIKSTEAYKVEFKLEVENQQNGKTTTQDGIIIIKGEKYKLTLDKVVQYFNGMIYYNYMPDENEVTITKESRYKEDFANNPMRLFTIYNKEFKYRLLGEVKFNNKECYEIDLYPYDLNKKYAIIKLIIDRDKNEPVAAKVKMKTGVHYTINISKFNTNIKVDDKEFEFDVKAYKDIEIIDLRKK